MALVGDIQLQDSAVKPPALDTSKKFSAEGLTATTAFAVTDAGAGNTVSTTGLITAKSSNDVSAWLQTTKADGNVSLYLSNDARPDWALKVAGTASDAFVIGNSTGANDTCQYPAFSIGTAGAVGVGKTGASNILDITYRNSSTGGIVLTEATNSIASKFISEASSGSIGTTTNSKFGFRTNSATVGAFDTSGNFGIGTDAPGATLDVRGGAIFNEAGGAVDFRVEGDTKANLFFVDGSTDRIGIGTATPAVLIDVDEGDASCASVLMCVNGCICAVGYLGEKQGHTIEDAGVAETQRTGLNFVLTNVGCVVDDSSNDATVVCINGANTCVPFLMCDGSTSDPIPLTGGSIGNQLANDSSPCLGGTLNGCDENVCCICCLAIKGCYFGDGSQLTGVSSVPSSFSADCTIIGCDAGGNVAAGGAKIVLIGGNAGYNATTPSNIVVMGSSAALCMTTATDTVLIGTGSGRCVLTCAGNLALGAWSLYNECAGSFNTALGTCAGLTQKGATTNTFVGAYAGTAVSTGSGNVFVGYKAGCAATTGNCCLIIGNGTCDLITGDFNGGKVGIGTTTPGSALEVAYGATQKVAEFWGTAATSFVVVSSDAETQNNQSGIAFNATTGNIIGSANSVAGIAGLVTNSGGTLTGDMIFSVNGGDDYGENMRLTSDGSLGIGTTAVGGSPGAGSVQFHKDANNYVRIWDNATATMYLQANGANAPTIAMKNSDSDSLEITTFQRTNAGGNLYGQCRNGLMQVSGAPNGSFAIGTSNAKNLVLGTNNTAAVTIDSSQNIGIGQDPVTPGDSGSSQVSLAINNELILGELATTNGAISTADSLWINVDSNNNQSGAGINFAHNAYGTSGTILMTIKDTGLVGIGTTAPGDLLHLNSSGALSLAIQSTHANIANTFKLTVSDPSGTTGTTGSGIAISSDQCDRGLFFRQDGHVGIGTTAPTQKLDVYTADNGLPIMTMCNTAVCGRGLLLSAGCGCSDHYLMRLQNIASGSVFHFTGDGRLGIGTAAPEHTLHLQDVGQNSFNTKAVFDLEGTRNSGYTQATIELASEYGTGGSGNFRTSAIAAELIGDQSATDIVFYNESTERMRLTNGGRLGLGTADPGGIIEARTSVSGRYIFNGSNHNTSSNGEIFIRGCGTGNNHNYYQVQNDAGCGLVIGIAGSGASTVGANLGYIYMNQYGCVMTFHPTTGATYVNGAFSKASGSFRITHPLESKKDTHELVHSFTESPQADLLYSGWTQLTSGTATIDIDTIHDMTDGTFVALNRCIRVFTSNESDWDMVRGSVTGNQLTIESNNSSSVACVSWLVIGERCDKHMFDTDWTDEGGRVIVEPLADMTVGDIPDDPESVHNVNSVNKTE